MTHLEPVEPRHLLSAAALDTAFGTDGIVDLGDGVHTNSVLGTSGSIYVQARTADEVNYVYKFTDAGQPDLSWGDNGRAALPLDRGAQTLALDRHSGKLYAAGVYEPVENGTQGFQMTRFTPRGAVDTAYGDHGIARYISQVSGTARFDPTVRHLFPLAHGGVLVDLQSQYVTSLTSGTGDRETSLLRFRNNGKRDPAFGRRGIRTIFSGAFNDDQSDPDARTQTYDVPLLEDLQFRPDGGYRVIASRTRGTQSYANSASTPDRTAEALIESRVVTADGTIVNKRSQTWSVGTSSSAAGDGDNDVRPLAATAVGNFGATAIVIRKADEPLVFRLGKDQAADVTALVLPGSTTSGAAAYQVSAFANHRGYFIQNGNRSLVKLRPALNIDRSFGDHGVARQIPLAADDYAHYFPDADGRLLELTTTAIRRLA